VQSPVHCLKTVGGVDCGVATRVTGVPDG